MGLMIKSYLFLLTLIISSTTWSQSLSNGGGWSGSGGDTALFKDNVWFLKTRESVPYCFWKNSDYQFSYEGKEYSGSIESNQIELLPIPYSKVNISFTPTSNVDLGSGFGQKIDCEVWGGEVGLFFDCRLKNDSDEFIINDKQMLSDWYNKIGVYSL